MSSIGLSFNAYREENALPGLLENASQFFDEIVMVSAPPKDGNNDDTIDIAKKWGAKVVHSTIEYGFGAVRSQCIRESSCEWVVIMDADERIQWIAPSFRCEGTESWHPELCPKPDLNVAMEGIYPQNRILRELVDRDENVDAIQFIRRHWFDFSYANPTQNWMTIPDWQMRCVRNRDYISYKGGMHEGIQDLRTGQMPVHHKFDQTNPVGLFFDHFHLYFKEMEKEQRQEDIAIYNRIHDLIDKKGQKEPGT